MLPRRQGITGQGDARTRAPTQVVVHRRMRPVEQVRTGALRMRVELATPAEGTPVEQTRAEVPMPAEAPVEHMGAGAPMPEGAPPHMG